MGFVLGHAGPGCSAHVRGMRGGAELRGRGRGPTATPSRPHRRPPRRHSRSRSGLAAGSRPLTSLYVLCIYIHRRNKGIKKKKKEKEICKSSRWQQRTQTPARFLRVPGDRVWRKEEIRRPPQRQQRKEAPRWDRGGVGGPGSLPPFLPPLLLAVPRAIFNTDTYVKVYLLFSFFFFFPFNMLIADICRSSFHLSFLSKEEKKQPFCPSLLPPPAERCGAGTDTERGRGAALRCGGKHRNTARRYQGMWAGKSEHCSDGFAMPHCGSTAYRRARFCSCLGNP